MDSDDELDQQPIKVLQKPTITRFRLKIRQLNHCQFEVLVTSDMTVQDLKSILGAQIRLDQGKMRLISSGKLLQDDKQLTFYSLKEGSVVQLTEKPEIPEPEPSEVPSSRRPRSIDQQERFEAMRQNISTSSLMFDVLTPKAEEEIIGFDNTRRKFQQGQWVDVLDTVDQWLEAQILEIANTSTGSMVFVHYNGWPSQWDEWLDSGSPRIQPFHSYTNQSITAPMHSPYPSIPVDEGQIRIQGATSADEMIQNGSCLLSRMRIILEKFHKVSSLVKFEKASEKTLEKRSRVGLESWEDSKDLGEIIEKNYEEDSFSMDLDQESIESEEIRDLGTSTDTEMALLTVQTAPLMDRVGRLLTDLAHLSQNSVVPVMPSPEELSQINSSGRNDMGIHIYAFVTPRRIN